MLCVLRDSESFVASHCWICQVNFAHMQRDVAATRAQLQAPNERVWMLGQRRSALRVLCVRMSFRTCLAIQTGADGGGAARATARSGDEGDGGVDIDARVQATDCEGCRVPTGGMFHSKALFASHSLCGFQDKVKELLSAKSKQKGVDGKRFDDGLSLHKEDDEEEEEEQDDF